MNLNCHQLTCFVVWPVVSLDTLIFKVDVSVLQQHAARLAQCRHIEVDDFVCRSHG